MNDDARHSPVDREALRAYLLDTLAPPERARIEAFISDSPEWQRALDEERGQLAQLDRLNQVAPESDLTAQLMARIREEEGRRSWVRGVAGMAVAACAFLVVGAFILLPAFSRARESARRSSTQNNFKQLGLVLKMYANESPGEKLPPVSRYAGYWVPDLELLFPEYLTDCQILVNPTHPEAGVLTDALHLLFEQEPIDWKKVTHVAAQSIHYTGWATSTAAELELVRETRPKLACAAWDEDLVIGDTTIYRLREGIERFFITDVNNPAASSEAQATVPILFEVIPPQGAARRRVRNMLYLHGGVEVVRFGDEFPADQTDRTDQSDILRPAEE